MVKGVVIRDFSLGALVTGLGGCLFVVSLSLLFSAPVAWISCLRAIPLALFGGMLVTLLRGFDRNCRWNERQAVFCQKFEVVLMAAPSMIALFCLTVWGVEMALRYRLAQPMVAAIFVFIFFKAVQGSRPLPVPRALLTVVLGGLFVYLLSWVVWDLVYAPLKLARSIDTALANSLPHEELTWLIAVLAYSISAFVMFLVLNAFVRNVGDWIRTVNTTTAFVVGMYVSFWLTTAFWGVHQVGAEYITRLEEGSLSTAIDNQHTAFVPLPFFIDFESRSQPDVSSAVASGRFLWFFGIYETLELNHSATDPQGR